MKKGLKALLVSLLATSCCTAAFAISGCGDDAADNGGNLPAHTQHVDSNNDGICDECKQAMPQVNDEYIVSITGAISVDLGVGDEYELDWTVKKNGSVIDNEPVTVTIDNDNVTYDQTSKKLRGAKKGQSKVTITLDRDSEIKATLNVSVREFFFSHEIQRGDWNYAQEDSETNPKISITGGQAAIVVKQPATKYVFKYTLNMQAMDVVSDKSFGIGAFLPSGGSVGDNALWFGLRGTAERGVFGLFYKNFLAGWSAEGGSEGYPAGYTNLQTGFENIEFVIIRDGQDYYCSIGGYYYKFTIPNNAAYKDEETYAGIYGQEIAFDASQYSYSTVEADVAAAIETYYTNRGVAVVAINETYNNEIVKGERETYTAAAYPTGKASAALVWSLEKDEMTSGADGTTVTAAADGASATLQLAQDAAGYVTLVCSTAEADGNISRRLRVKILQQNPVVSNDYATAYGGALLDGTGSAWTLTFPETLAGKNGIILSETADEQKYKVTKYCAVLKNDLAKDYSLQFKFSDYKAITNAPKLQLSLGTDNNNIYLVFVNNKFRVESFTQRTQNDGTTGKGWCNTDWKNIDGTTEHTFKLAVSDRGIYTVFLDGDEMPFFAHTPNGLGNPSTIVRPYDNYDAALPVKIATNGCSVKLTDFTITDGTKESSQHKFWSMHQSYTFQGENGFTMVVPQFFANSDGWQYGAWSDYKTYYTGTLDNNGYAIDCNVEFGSLMTDGKFVMRVGNANNFANENTGAYEIQFTSKPQGVGVELRRGGSWKSGTIKIDNAKPRKMAVRLEVKDGKLRLIINGRVVFNIDHTTTTISTNGKIEFYMFNNTAADVWSTSDNTKTVALSDFVVTGNNFVAADVYELNSTKVGNWLYVSPETTGTAIPVRILHNGVAFTADAQYTIEYALSGDDANMFALEGGTVKRVADNLPDRIIEAVVTATLKNGGNAIDTESYTVSYTGRQTSNNVIEVKGGAILNYDTDPNAAGWAVTFPTGQIVIDGVVNEHQYAEAEYTANLKQRVKGDTTVEFTVSNYTSQTSSPKLMVSLGGEHNQFYFVYKQGSGFRLEVVVPRVNTGYGYWEDNGWLTSAWDTSFDPAANNTFKIERIGGVYNVYRKVGENYNRIIVGENGSIGSHTMASNMESYIGEMPVRIATKNVACTVSDIKVTTGTVGKFYYTTGNVTCNTDALAIKAYSSGWSNEAGGNKPSIGPNRAQYTGIFASGQTMEFDLEFSAAMGDGKFAMNIGGANFFVENKLSQQDGKINLCSTDWVTNSIAKSDLTSTDGKYKLHIKVVRNAKDVTVTATDKTSNATATYSGTEKSNETISSLHFWVFNSEANEANVTATITNFTISQNA